MAKLFYVKYHVEDGIFILDQVKRKVSPKEMMVVPYKITKAQGKMLKDRVDHKYGKKSRNPFMNEIKHEFDTLFHVCKECQYVTTATKVNKAWGNVCSRCFRIVQAENKRKYQAQKDQRKKIRRYRRYLKTMQGRIDSVPIEVIGSNVRIEIVRQGKTQREIAQHLGITDGMFSVMFAKKKVNAEDLQAICEYLGIPIEKTLRLPPGVTVKRQDGIPKHWLKEGFRMRNVK